MLANVSVVTEIADAVKCTSIPGSIFWFRGLGSVRGQVVPISDLSGFLFGQNGDESEHNRLLLVRREEEIFGLLVEEILGLRRYSHTQLLHEKNDIPSEIQEFVVETIHDGEQWIPVLDPVLLVDSKRFLDIQSGRKNERQSGSHS